MFSGLYGSKRCRVSFQATDLSLVLGRLAQHSMHLGYTYILLSLLSYSSLGILHKVAEVKNCRALSISILMCAWCLVFLLAIVVARGKSLYPPLTIVTLALPFGISAGIAILALQTALELWEHLYQLVGCESLCRDSNSVVDCALQGADHLVKDFCLNNYGHLHGPTLEG